MAILSRPSTMHFYRVKTREY